MGTGGLVDSGRCGGHYGKCPGWYSARRSVFDRLRVGVEP